MDNKLIESESEQELIRKEKWLNDVVDKLLLTDDGWKFMEMLDNYTELRHHPSLSEKIKIIQKSINDEIAFMDEAFL